MQIPDNLSGASAAPSASPAPASLRAQLERYQHQLADCVNCSSASTPEGKAAIDGLAARIAAVQARLAQGERADRPASRSSPMAAAVANAPAASAMLAKPATSGLGSLIDVYA